LAVVEGRVSARWLDYVQGSGLVVDLLNVESAYQREKTIRYQELRCRGWNLEDAALENAGVLLIQRYHGAPGLGNEQQKELIHQSTPMVFFGGPGTVEASYPIPLGFALEDKQRSLDLRKHSANGLGEIEIGPG